MPCRVKWGVIMNQKIRLCDKELHNRLENIRGNLDAYIDSRLSREEDSGYEPFYRGVPNNRQKFFAAGGYIGKHEKQGGLKKGRKHSGIDRMLENKEESFSETLLHLIDEKGLKDSDVYKSANIDRRLFSKIRIDDNYVPSRKTAISFCLALQLEMDEAEKLLATAGYTLSASSRFDIIIMYLIENGEYNIHFANIVLDDYGEGTLSR